MSDKVKYLLIAALVIISIGADQATKLWASARLANPRQGEYLIDGPHHFEIQVPPSAQGTPLVEFLRADLSGTPDDEVQDIARRWTLINGEPAKGVEAPLAGGEVLTIKNRTIEVVPDYFHFRYTRNPGAAFSFLASAGESVRRPFFIIVSFLAVIVIGVILRRTPGDQRFLIVALALIVGGAVGNLIDRIAYGWVIDFIDWHVRRDYTWPTFNIADAAISVGIVMMAIDMLRKSFAPDPEKEQKDKEKAEEAEASNS